MQGLPDGGLTDCESHGTIVASIIGAAPANPADRPTPRPAGAGRRRPGVPGQPGATSVSPAADDHRDRDSDRARTAARAAATSC